MSTGSLKYLTYELFIYKGCIFNTYVWTGLGIKLPISVKKKAVKHKQQTDKQYPGWNNKIETSS